MLNVSLTISRKLPASKKQGLEDSYMGLSSMLLHILDGCFWKPKFIY